MNDKTRQVLIHLVGSVGFLALPFLFMSQTRVPMQSYFNPLGIKDILNYVLLVLFFYLNYYLLIPSLYFKKKYLSFFMVVGLAFVAIIYLPDLLVSSPPPKSFPVNAPSFPGPPPPSPHGDSLFTQHLFLFLIVFFFSLVLRISNQWRQTEREKLNAELSYLKAQINPHFLFNTLNSIYSLAIEKSDHTATAVVKLSGMMRYVLSESANDFVPLTKEIDYIQNYIELQQIRFGDSISLSFGVNGVANGKKITPLILIPFVENAFKHGVNAEEYSLINIQLDMHEKELQLKVFNNKVTVKLSEENKSGLGIDNTKNRLNLLYPERHSLTIEDAKDSYSVILTMTLS